MRFINMNDLIKGKKESFIKKCLELANEYPFLYLFPIGGQFLGGILKIDNFSGVFDYFLRALVVVLFPALGFFILAKKGKLDVIYKFVIFSLCFGCIALYSTLTGIKRAIDALEYKDSYIINWILNIIPDYLGYLIYYIYLFFPLLALFWFYHRIWKKYKNQKI